MVTPEQHSKYLAWSHIAYGSLFMLMMIAFMSMFGLAVFFGPGGPPMGFMIAMWLFFGLFYGAMTIPSFVAGYGLLKGKPWSKTAAIIAGVLAAMSFPMGTAVCVYTFWFLFSEPGKALFEKQKLALPPRRQAWAINQAQPETEQQYVPPSTPPDWR